MNNSKSIPLTQPSRQLLLHCSTNLHPCRDPSGEGFVYPCLSAAQQQNLPKLIQASPLPKMFDDSTHQLWQCDTVEGEFMLKVCDGNVVTRSTFWQGMSLLFDVQLPAQLGEFKHVYDLVSQNSPLTIPDYIASDSENENKEQKAFILTRMIPGSMVEPKDVDDEMVIALAKHLSQLHAQKETIWGRATEPKFALNDWSDRLQYTLTVLAEQQNIPEELLAEALAQAKATTPDYAVPNMLDLRWDQFLKIDGELSSLVDLDAIVFAPRELELVLLEYLLTSDQARVFISEYLHDIDLLHVRIVYRLLLFMMNILGEKDLERWMMSPTLL